MFDFTNGNPNPVTFFGHIFEYNGSWWYIKNYYGNQYDSFGVVKCTKTGKLFSARTSFKSRFIYEWAKEGKLIPVGETAKVSDAGKAAGIARRRLTHLKGEIETYVAEFKLSRDEYLSKMSA